MASKYAVMDGVHKCRDASASVSVWEVGMEWCGVFRWDNCGDTEVGPERFSCFVSIRVLKASDHEGSTPAKVIPGL